MSHKPIQQRAAAEPLQRKRILHCLRAPVGGLFRHVVDLAGAQAALGHHVGVVCAATGDALTEARLLALSPHLHLGLYRLHMSRGLGRTDFQACRNITSMALASEADVIHGHGAKGGAYARLAARKMKLAGNDVRCFYTPHGGSLHFAPTTLAGQAIRHFERTLETWTDGILFESQFARQRYVSQIGTPRCVTSVVTNGLLPADFERTTIDPDASDFLFVGELRHLKGVDVALEALARVNRTRSATAVIVGSGPDAVALRGRASALGLDGKVKFTGAIRARDAFALGRVMLVPSRAESLPYIVLESIAAGLPVIASNVGGIPEIIAPQYGPLLPPGDVAALSAAMAEALAHPQALQHKARALRSAIQHTFTVAGMATGVTAFYGGTGVARHAAVA